MRLVLCGLMLVVVPVVAFGPLAAEEPANAAPIIYECKDADGNVSFQDDPCPVAPPKPKAAPKPKPAAKAKPEATPKAAAKTSAAAKPPDATKTLAGTKLSATTKPAEKAKPKRALLPPLTLPAPPAGCLCTARSACLPANTRSVSWSRTGTAAPAASSSST